MAGHIGPISSSASGSKTPITILRTHSFVLRAVQPFDILAKYDAGYFSNITEPVILGRKALSTPMHGTHLGSTVNDRMYAVRERGVAHCIIGTTGQEMCEAAKDGDGTHLPAVGHCTWCRYPIRQDPVGIPIRTDRDPESGGLIFLVDDKFCNFSCCLAYLKYFDRGGYVGDPLYTNSITLLHQMFSLMHPDKELIEAPHFRTLISFDGFLTKEEFDSCAYRYIRTANIYVCPIKVLYIQTKRA